MKAEEFWNWFIENKEKYEAIHINDTQSKQDLIGDFLETLHSYCEGLFFKMGGQPGQKMELIITAEGNQEYFEKVEELVSSAPDLDDWIIVAFKPPMDGDFIIEYEGLELDSSEIYFLPLQNQEKPELIGIILAVPGYEPDDKERFIGAAYQLLDTLIGEKSTTEDIYYLDLDTVPENPKEEGYLHLSELRRYIDWHKDGIVPFQFSLN
jgi:hypothetical protein